MKSKNGQTLAEHLNVIFLDLLEIKKLVGTPVSELTPVQKWGLFLSYADDEKQVAYINKIAESEKGIMEAERIVGRMSEEDSNWFRQFSIDTYRRDQNAIREATIKEGLNEGLKKGLEKGLKEGLQKGLKEGLSKGRNEKALETAENLIKMKILTVEQIAQATSLPPEKIQELQKSIAEGKK